MSSTRFPKQAYVRRLEIMFAEFNEWRDLYSGSLRNSLSYEQAARFKARVRVLDKAQRQLMDVVFTLEDLPRVS